MVQTEFVEGAKASEIPDGKEVCGTANVGGKFSAISHSCSHIECHVIISWTCRHHLTRSSVISPPVFVHRHSIHCLIGS